MAPVHWAAEVLIFYLHQWGQYMPAQWMSG